VFQFLGPSQLTHFMRKTELVLVGLFCTKKYLKVKLFQVLVIMTIFCLSMKFLSQELSQGVQ